MFTKTQLAVATISTAIYLDTLRYEFTYDDKKAVVTNIDVQEVRNSLFFLYATDRPRNVFDLDLRTNFTATFRSSMV